METTKILRYLFVFLLPFFSGCIEEIQLDYRDEKGILVVDGLITDQAPPYSITLSYTGNFESSRRPPDENVVTGAKVIVIDDLGGEVEFFQDPEKGGLYNTRDLNYKGIPGITYTLKVILADGRTYVSTPEKLLPVPEVDSITTEFADLINVDSPDGYRVYVTIPEQSESQYYRWFAYSLVYTGNCWAYTRSTDTPILDNVVNGNTIKKKEVFFCPIYSSGHQYIEISQYSLSEDAYQFWKVFKEQRDRTGSIFDPIPAPVQGNVQNVDDPDDIALGYFGASSVRKRRIVREFHDQQQIAGYKGRFDSYIECVPLPETW